MRKLLFAVTLLCAMLLSPLALAQENLNLNCTSALLIDGSSGEVLYEQNSDAKCYPASITKIMTLVLALDAVDAGRISLEDEVIVSAAAASMGGSQVYLYEGEVRTVHDMLIAIAVGSGNDASYAMAEFVGGTYDNFISMMNEKAAELGMVGTNFANPHGLHDDNHYTTAADMGKLAYYAISVPLMLEYTSIYEYEFRSDPLLTLWSTNRLLKWYEGTDGLKTGYTSQAGRNLVTTVERNGLRFVSVILGGKEKNSHFTLSMQLLNYGYNNYSSVELHPAGSIIAELAVSKGKVDTVQAVVEDAVCYSVKKGEEYEINEIVNTVDDLRAPICRGDVVGSITIYRDGVEWQTIDLVAADDVEKGGLFRTWGKLLKAMW